VEFVDGVIARRAGRREWIGLAVLTLPCLLYAMDLTVLNLAVPHLSEDLRPSSTQLLWIIDIYGFLAAGSLVTMGTLGDRIGRRRLRLIGAAAFGAASLLAAWSTSAAMLIAARALLGLAGATVAPSTLSLIRDMFLDPGQRTVAISVWITSFSVGGAVGPLLGGVLLEWFWWGSVFLLAVPVMALLLVLGLSALAAGLWMLLPSAGFILGSMLTPVLARRVRPAFVMAAGLALAAVGLGLFTQLGSASGLAILVTGSVVFSLALAPLDTLATDLAVGAAPPERAGAASALSETGAEFGGALGIAVLGVIGTRIYRSQLTEALPAGILPNTAAAARDTLGSAVAAAGQLPGQPGQVLVRAARQAFTQGLHVAFAISAAAVLGAAVLAAVQLRHLGPSSEPRLGSATQVTADGPVGKLLNWTQLMSEGEPFVSHHFDSRAC
jgi:predicted MFS family arabinose efflux permease